MIASLKTQGLQRLVSPTQIPLRRWEGGRKRREVGVRVERRGERKVKEKGGKLGSERKRKAKER